MVTLKNKHFYIINLTKYILFKRKTNSYQMYVNNDIVMKNKEINLSF